MLYLNGHMSTRLSNLGGNLNDVFKEQRLSYSNFFYQIALFSAGTISLNITFLGFLNVNKTEFKSNQLFLIASWLLLIVSLIASIFRNHVYNHFGHYQAISEYNEEVYRITGEEDHKKDLGETRSEEEWFERLWKITEDSALISFPLGLIVLIFFAGIELLK